jgi:hypothetical protein
VHPLTKLNVTVTSQLLAELHYSSTNAARFTPFEFSFTTKEQNQLPLLQEVQKMLSLYIHHTLYHLNVFKFTGRISS